MNQSSERSEQISALFAAALARPSSEHASFVAAHAEDPSVASEVLELLGYDAAAAHALDALLQPIAAEGPGNEDRAPNLESPAALPRVRGFRISRHLGSGGMGSVFEAEQEHPRRAVALKLLNSSLLRTPEVQRRFEHEAQLLARLEHEGIARLYQAGAAEHPSGAPYYAMELVAGRPFLEHTTARSLALRAKLELFLRVLDAVQHAHQRGIIHRDLKPANILVTELGEPKVLDFGIARELEGADDRSQLTSAGQVLGTLAYMSPEQAQGDPDIDVRADVYSLGVLLYELIAGRPPYELGGKGLTAALRHLCEVEPTPIGRVVRAARGDLENIVSKALAKERPRRYESAGAFAADLRRYLAHEPVLAHRPSALYVLRKFARRHVALVAASTSAALALLAGAAFAFAFALEASREAERAKTEAGRADRERDRARLEAQSAERFVGFIRETFLRVDPGRATRADPTLREALDAIGSTLDRRLEAEPQLRQRVHSFLGAIYHSLGHPDLAERHLGEAVRLGDELKLEDEYAQRARLDLAFRLQKSGRFREARALAERVLEGVDALDDRATRELVRANATLSLGESALGENELASAQRLLEESLAQRRALFGQQPHEEVAIALLLLGKVAIAARRFEEAEHLAREHLSQRQRIHTAPHPAIAESMHELAYALWLRERFEEATPWIEEAVRQRELTLPRDHPAHISSRSALAAIREQRGDLAGAIAQYAELEKRVLEIFGAEHPHLYELRYSQAALWMQSSRLEEAEPRFRRLLEELGAKNRAGQFPLRVIACAHSLAAILISREELLEAEALLLRARELEERLEVPSGFLGSVLKKLVLLADRAGRTADAERWRQELAALPATKE